MNVSDIIERAEQINRLSLNYHLAHASLACEMIIQDEVKEGIRHTLSEINKEKERALKRNDYAEFERLCQKEGGLQRKNTIRIYVEYIDGGEISETSGRVIFFENHFTISLSKSLLTKSMGDTNTYTSSVSELREVMAHELGHVALHYKDLFVLSGIRGSKALSKEKDDEANLFAKYLLKLRSDRNRKMIDDGSLVAHFTQSEDK